MSRGKGRPQSPNPRYLLDLLDNEEFQKDARTAQDKFNKVIQARAPGESIQAAHQRCSVEILRDFHAKWRLLPPRDPRLFRSEAEIARDARNAAMLTGRWGLIRVFPWTTEDEVVREYTAVRRRLPREGLVQEANTREAKHEFLTDNGVSRRAANAELIGKKTTRRLTLEEAGKRLPEERERELLKRYMARGLTKPRAEAEVWRRARGSEAPGAARLRVARTRRAERKAKGMAAIESPNQVEPLAGKLTELLRLMADVPPHWQLPPTREQHTDAFLRALERLQAALTE